VSERPPSNASLVDAFGRVATDLRVSVIDRCNFRCRYCMPAEGLPWLARDETLTADEIERLVRLFVGLGVRAIKFTGGEPTVRPDLPDLVRRVRAIRSDLDLSLTTNGYLLDRLAGPLRAAGLDRVTVSCDSLMAHRFAEMTRRDALGRVTAGMRAASSAGFSPIKVNCVVIRGSNEDEVVDFARLARRTGYGVRFIEYMPLDADRKWDRSNVMPSSDVFDAISRTFPLAPVRGRGGAATMFRFADDAPGAVGFISSVTEPFCESCDRLRLTADGRLLACLFALEDTDLRTPLRAGASDADLSQLIRHGVSAKWAGHRINQPDFARPTRSMSMIGG
jgi:cyclic pyranopterin phosphate synthase